ncbi:hypothetical protein NKR19_g9587 [Coniochaeta hoffmannii]|uniref:Uncharacterized protein n=1 Tax=Coniochaeta hoffmannii TaxID=91930 RepID=A0AA38VGX9_9PEZI|nr:hypothetical protein NKR19_g9587 [Coniochaeta hoffmannii]
MSASAAVSGVSIKMRRPPVLLAQFAFLRYETGSKRNSEITTSGKVSRGHAGLSLAKQPTQESNLWRLA